MNNLACRLPQAMIAAALVITSLTPVRAQQRNAVAVVSLSSIDSLLGKVRYLTQAAGMPEFGTMATMLSQPYSVGLDRQKPAGFAVWSDGTDFVPLAFLPVTDLQATLSALEEQLGEPKDAGNGVLELAGPQPVFVKEQNGVAFLGQTVESMSAIPANPRESLGTLPADYDVALRVNIQNIPQSLREMALNTLRDSVRQGLQQNEEEADEDFALRERMVQAQLDQMNVLAREMDQITVGWKTDTDARHTYLDVTLTATGGSKTAQQMALMQDSQTDFAGFLERDAAITMNSSSKIPPDQIDQTVALLDNLRQAARQEIEDDEKLKSPEDRQAARDLLDGVLEILAATIKSGELDAGASVLLQPRAMTVLVGMQVADGAAVDETVRKVARLAADEPDFPGIQFDADRQGDVTFHTMAIPVPEGEDARKVLGERLDVAVGIGARHVYLGLGADCLTKLKETLGQSGSATPTKAAPFQLTVSLNPLLEFLGSVANNPVISAMREALPAEGQRDQLVLRGIPVSNGLTYRFRLEEGVLGALGQGIKAATGAAR
jgi:hypothetical protein